jgi:hypothetical protein
MRKTLSASMFALLLLAGPAWARSAEPFVPFAKGGSVSLAVERLFGFNYLSPSEGNSITSFSLLGAGGLEAGAAPYSIPRVAFDYFLVDGLSIGLSTAFAVYSPQGADSTTEFAFYPRIGYALRLHDVLHVWPRFGISYLHNSSGDGSYLMAMTMEVMLVVTPVRHFGFTFGPNVDIGLAATGSRLTQFGAQFGLIGWF